MVKLSNFPDVPVADQEDLTREADEINNLKWQLSNYIKHDIKSFIIQNSMEETMTVLVAISLFLIIVKYLGKKRISIEY